MNKEQQDGTFFEINLLQQVQHGKYLNRNHVKTNLYMKNVNR